LTLPIWVGGDRPHSLIPSLFAFLFFFRFASRRSSRQVTFLLVSSCPSVPLFAEQGVIIFFFDSGSSSFRVLKLTQNLSFFPFVLPRSTSPFCLWDISLSFLHLAHPGGFLVSSVFSAQACPCTAGRLVRRFPTYLGLLRCIPVVELFLILVADAEAPFVRLSAGTQVTLDPCRPFRWGRLCSSTECSLFVVSV